jgi:hypothetical protein
MHTCSLHTIQHTDEKVGSIGRDKDDVHTTEAKLREHEKRIDSNETPFAKRGLSHIAVCHRVLLPSFLLVDVDLVVNQDQVARTRIVGAVRWDAATSEW